MLYNLNAMNNKTNRLIVAFLGMVFSLVTFFSCKEKEPTDPNTNCTTCHSVLEAKEYFAFKQGSYWVYEEEITHERDSMYVTQSWIGADYDFYVKIKSLKFDFVYTYWPNYFPNAGDCSKTNSVSDKCLYVHRNKSKPLNNLGDTRSFFVNYKIGDNYGTNEWGSNCTENMLIFENIFNSYQISGYNFERTIKISESCSYHYDNQKVNLYYSKGVGIVRKELIDSNEVWNLVKYKIAL